MTFTTIVDFEPEYDCCQQERHRIGDNDGVILNIEPINQPHQNARCEHAIHAEGQCFSVLSFNGFDCLRQKRQSRQTRSQITHPFKRKTDHRGGGGANTSREPLDSGGLTTPAFSISSMMRAARL